VQKRAAELLHIKPTTLNEMIKRYDIRPRRRKAANDGDTAAAGRRPSPGPSEEVVADVGGSRYRTALDDE
jgi:hypothetical protein